MNNAKVVLVALLAIVASAAASVAQAGGGVQNRLGVRDPPRCPTITVECPDMGLFGQPIKFSASVVGGDPAVIPTVKWTVPGFRILSGQGTFTITVEPPAYGGTVLATVEAAGYERACPNTANCTTSIISDPGPSKVGEYGNVRLRDEKAHIDKFAVELRNDPTAQGYLVCYGGRRSPSGEAQRRCDRAKEYASTHFRGIDSMRIVTVDAGYREQPAVELWVVPSGANPPQSTPTVDPQKVRPAAPPRKPRRRIRR